MAAVTGVALLGMSLAAFLIIFFQKKSPWAPRGGRPPPKRPQCKSFPKVKDIALAVGRGDFFSGEKNRSFKKPSLFARKHG